MANPKGTCTACNRNNMTITGRGMCGNCYAKWAKAKKEQAASIIHYPQKIMIPCFETSDGKEWGNEIDALRHQLTLERKK